MSNDALIRVSADAQGLWVSGCLSANLFSSSSACQWDYGSTSTVAGMCPPEAMHWKLKARPTILRPLLRGGQVPRFFLMHGLVLFPREWLSDPKSGWLARMSLAWNIPCVCSHLPLCVGRCNTGIPDAGTLTLAFPACAAS